jgi:hypothetical protein
MSKVDHSFLLMNHSCLPNVSCKTYDNKTVTAVLFPIKTGGQIFRQYFDGPLLAKPKAER